ncbi:thioredoxin domain-containing protein [Pseudactinotalea terrae]|uniref:thioredoxin domain-containing protein n=1 Tax=Pseudactinotalea terrae TaxID=1743262 RepID=UPI0012E23EC3|nr:thioredoxin domain-containing protein [Pseudactinotalea terrae]
MTNRLADSLSPYLRQHADNPVDWWEWGAEAFEEARRRDVPIFLSIGYAACHWCHVMAHESFEDPAVAELLNESVVAIKVDREERPDVDQIYMDVTVALTGQGGWPMSVWLTPEGHAFHAGTYYPPQPHPSMMSFTQVLTAIIEAWRTDREKILEGGPRITAELATRALPAPAGTLTGADIDQAIGSLLAHADQLGGFGDKPKFPPSTILDALLARAAQGDGPVADQAWHVARLTLERMGRGGIYDQLAGGFARYATDRAWVIPHFEKMLYDNALLIGCYARGAIESQRRDDPIAALCERVVAETIEWLTTEMLTEQGAFASSLDADSIDPADGRLREGASYVWTYEQLVQTLGEVDGPRAARLLSVDEHRGSFEHGTSTLQLSEDPDDPAWFADVRRRLHEARRQRPAPARDDKVVAAWNGWAVASLVEAGMLLGRPDWVAVAERAATAVLDVQLDDGRLRRVSLAGVASTAPGAADDHAGMALGLLALASATGDPTWLTSALGLLEVLEQHFVADDGGVHDSADDAEALVRRPRDVSENATPSGTTAALRACRAAYRITGEDHWRARSDALAATVAAYVIRAPRASGWAMADAVAEHGSRRPVEVAIVGEAAGGVMTGAAWRGSPPGSVVVTGQPDSGIPLLASRPQIDDAATAYVCHGHVCDLPVTAVERLQRLIA